MATPTAADVRAWARSKEIAVGTRGHISTEIIGQYNKGRRNKFQNTNPAAQTGA